MAGFAGATGIRLVVGTAEVLDVFVLRVGMIPKLTAAIGTIDEVGGTYREKNGHLIPDITLLEQTDYQIGKYGRMYLDYIKNHRRGRYTTLLTEGTLNARLREIDLDANEMLDTIIPRLAAERGIDENLKARDMLRWVAEMNNIKASAEEIVLREVVLV